LETRCPRMTWISPSSSFIIFSFFISCQKT
jgi:hypothetical protein